MNLHAVATDGTIDDAALRAVLEPTGIQAQLRAADDYRRRDSGEFNGWTDEQVGRVFTGNEAAQ